jgi:hypothetical protein
MNTVRVGVRLLLWCAFCLSAQADLTVIPKAVGGTSPVVERLANPGFEAGDTAWNGWMQAFEVVDGAGRNGSRGVRCVAGKPDGQHGAGQLVKLDQTAPCPIIISGWSRSENVDGSSDNGYSIYVDVNYVDDDHLWGQTGCFSVGTHDWEQRRVLLTPDKPVASLTALGLFRGHNGTVWFDDLSVVEAGGDSKVFEGVLVGQPSAPAVSGESCDVSTPDGLRLSIDKKSGAVTALRLKDAVLGESCLPVFVRDMAGNSDFIAPEWNVQQTAEGASLTGDVSALQLRLSLTFTISENTIQVNGMVQDLRGADRAVTVYVPLPVAGEWIWSPDMRRDVPARGLCMNAFRTGAGATGMRSSYPLAVLTGVKGGLALAAPIDTPRHDRLAYDADRNLFYAAFDLGLSSATKRSPGAASFRAILYACDPALRFRGALSQYYRLFPAAFEKRVPREGLWMAFTDISTLPNPEDFGFAYQEGAPNVAWDEQHGILSFPYTEPMTTWLKLAPEVPRSYDGAVNYLHALLDRNDDPLHESASVIAASSVLDGTGRSVLSVVNAPWCDGVVFALDADPAIPVNAPHTMNRGQAELKRLEEAVADTITAPVPEWPWRGTGTCAPSAAVKTEGTQSLCLAAATPGRPVDAFQTVPVSQTAAKALVMRAAIRTRDLTGVEDTDCSVYVDLVHADGTPLYCQAIPVAPGTREFQVVERRIVSDKPFAGATVHLLLRGAHTGTVWFDDLFLGEEGSTVNLLKNPGLEGVAEKGAVADGVYIDSYEFWSNNINYNAAHFANMDIPLVFDAQSCRVGALTVFSTFAWQREMAQRMHARGKFMFANGALASYDMPAAFLDVLGTETNWMPGGKWQPMTDAELCFRRALSAQKPYCFLMNAHYDDFTLELTERYMQRSLAYGMFPGFFSENASTDCYFATPKWYEPARPLFKKYLPLTQTIAKAGWEPVTFAKSDNAAVYVERFGKPESGTVYFTVLNDSNQPRKAGIEIDLAGMGLKDAEIKAQELIGGTDIAWSGNGPVQLDLNPEQALLIKVSQ